MGTLWPKSGSYEFDSNGDRAPGALAYFYGAGTSTPYAVYQDADEATPHENPVEADGNGRWPAVFVPFGTYKYVIKTSGGVTLFTVDSVPNPAPVDLETSVDENSIFQTGDYLIVGANSTRPGFVRCNGRTIGSATSSGTERANADCEDLFLYLWNNYADGQAAVSGGRGATAAADFSANKNIALPDHRTAGLVGFADMGATEVIYDGSVPTVSGNGKLAGSIIGANAVTLTEAQLASHTHAGTTGTESSTHTHAGTTTSDGSHSHTINITDPGHTHSQAANTMLFTGGAGALAGAPNTLSSGGTTGSNTTGITAASVATGNHTHTFTSLGQSVTHTHTFTSGTTGSGTTHNNVQRAVPVTVLMKL